MLNINKKKSYKKDIKKIKHSLSEKQKVDLEKVVEILMEEKTLPKKYYNHPLKGNWKGFYDCHISPDLVLLYEIDKENKNLNLTRLGSHSELFG